ncbi:Disease resistance protein [Quillaja saponaria]|uniref:Disease resistance protein n=1 Tax=Quillaja saponaria TaxID=32244 RepID=A0AAD7PDM5_QUISA|nr:Disease resistance protein [Quillaja saponaria]
MDISDCGIIEEIVTGEGSSDSSENVIVFKSLNSFTFDCLPKLASFFSGTYSLNFPSLKRLTVSQCPEMKSLCQGIPSAPDLKHVRLSETKLKKYIEEMFVQDLDYYSNEEEE